MKRILLYESYNNDIKIKLRKVLNFIKKRFKKSINPLFVYWIAKIFRIEDIIFISKIEMSEDVKDIEKVYFKLDDKFYDEKNVYDKEDLLEKHNINKFNYKDLVFKDNLKKLKELLEFEKYNISSKVLEEIKFVIQKIKDK